MRIARRWLFVCLPACVTPLVAQNLGAIAGVVRDQTGAVIPGVTVEASSTALIEGKRTTTTGGNGEYRIVDLRIRATQLPSSSRSEAGELATSENRHPLASERVSVLLCLKGRF